MHIDLNTLRGWHEHISPQLQAPHRLPPLLWLHGPRGLSFPIHGLRTSVGRFHPQHGPVDIRLDGLLDHELYRIHSPHMQLRFDEQLAQWQFRPAQAPASIHHNQLSAPHHQWTPLLNHDLLELGTTTFQVEITQHFSSWQRRRQRMLSYTHPALFLMRAGEISGQYHNLTHQHVIGRSAPDCTPEWDLAGLFDEERKNLAPRHIKVHKNGDEWLLTPLANRQRVFLNQTEIFSATPLRNHDRIGLGAIQIYFHLPDPDLRPIPPTLADWLEDSEPETR